MTSTEKKQLIVAVFIVAVLVVAAGYVFVEKPIEVTDIAYNISPAEGIFNRANLKLIESPDQRRVFRYRLRFRDSYTFFSDVFDARDYLADHPDDIALVQHDALGEYVVEIFTDEIDEKLFKLLSSNPFRARGFYFRTHLLLF